MHSLQDAQRILSGASCSTSNTASQSQCKPRSQARTASLPVLKRYSGMQSHAENFLLSARPILCGNNSSRRSASTLCVRADVSEPAIAPLSSTKYVAETCLPTRTGKYRVRAYRHSVGIAGQVFCMPVFGSLWQQQVIERCDYR